MLEARATQVPVQVRRQVFGVDGELRTYRLIEALQIDTRSRAGDDTLDTRDS